MLGLPVTPVAESARPPRNGPTRRHLRSENCDGSTVCANAAVRTNEKEARSRTATATILLDTAVLRSLRFYLRNSGGYKAAITLLVIVVFLLRAGRGITARLHGDRRTREQC